MIKEIKDFKRKELFEHYNSFDNPFAIITTKIDVTNIVNYCKEHKNFYATLGYLITKSANEIDAFKYRFSENKFYYCDTLKSNYTEMYEDETIGYFALDSIDSYSSYDDYIKKYKEIKHDFLNKKEYDSSNELNEIWLSCEPWFSSSSLVPPFNKKITIPQFIWDKYINIDDKYYVNLMIMVHHGFADGYHIGKFINLLNKNINEFN